MMKAYLQKLFLDEDYSYAISQIKRALQEDSSKSELFYYLFLAENGGYAHFDYNNIQSEINFNRALELEKNRRKRELYNAEFNLYRALDMRIRPLFYYASMLNLERYKDALLEFNDSLPISLEKSDIDILLGDLDYVISYDYRAMAIDLNLISLNVFYLVTKNEKILDLFLEHKSRAKETKTILSNMELSQNMEGIYKKFTNLEVNQTKKDAKDTLNMEKKEAYNPLGYLRRDNKIIFGSYPINRVTNEAQIEKLNCIIGALPNDNGYNGFKPYNYYISDKKSVFMFYRDIDINGDGLNEYRAVYIEQYRPILTSYESSDKKSYQDENGYSCGKLYWFSYSPIEWNILDEQNEMALIQTSLCIDSMDFHSKCSDAPFLHNGNLGYGNNYELSDLRLYLNQDILNQAFTDYQRNMIKKTMVKNDKESTKAKVNPYVSKNTEDKLFLLSRSEVDLYLGTLEKKQKMATDYSKCLGLYVSKSNQCSTWRLRTPSASSANDAYVVYSDGSESESSILRTHYGIAPACWIKL